jgi:hypothetical protein
LCEPPPTDDTDEDIVTVFDCNYYGNCDPPPTTVEPTTITITIEYD